MNHAEFSNRTAGARVVPTRNTSASSSRCGLRTIRAPAAGSDCVGGGRRFRLRWLLLLLVALGPQNLFSQAAPVSSRPSNRWLLIIETTRAMQPRAETVAQLAGNLVLAGMSGQLRPGDTVGVWTFNSDLHAGGFPLQTVTPDNPKAIAERVALFVATQKFEGRPGRDKVFPAMNSVISNSEFITVILITGGGEVVSGMPYDKAINAIHSKWQSQQDKARQPFLTMLRAQQGRITDFEVGMPPGPLAFPPLPPELQIPEPVAVKPVVPKPAEPAPVPVVPNLIVRGKKAEPAEEIISNPPPVIVEKTASAPSPATPTNAMTTKAATNFAAANVSASGVTNQSETTAAPGAVWDGKNLWVAGVVAALAAVGLVFVLVRRSRSQPRISLITRSLDRDKK